MSSSSTHTDKAKATFTQQHLSCCTAGWTLSIRGPQSWHSTYCLAGSRRTQAEEGGRREAVMMRQSQIIGNLVSLALLCTENVVYFFIPGQPDTTSHAFVGETVILPCTTTSPGELTTSNSMVYWQIESVVVHFFRNGRDSLESQDPRYHGRTSLFLDQMKHGNFSLKLSNVQLVDTAVYTCIYKQTGDLLNKTQKSKIKLIVSGKTFFSSEGGSRGQHFLLTSHVWPSTGMTSIFKANLHSVSLCSLLLLKE